MNKLFTKIVGTCLGLTMAVGVGVAVASSEKEAAPVKAVSYAWQKVTSTSEFVDGTILLITQGSYYLDASQAATGNTPRQGSLTLSSGLPTLTADNTCTLTVSGSGSSIKLVKSTDTSKYLYTNTSNNGTRIGTGSTAGQYWTISSAGTNEFYLASNASTTRYLSRYGTTDFRSYTNTNTNANLVLYKLVESQQTQTITVDPASKEAYTDETISLTTNATSASWALSNNTCGASLSAASGRTVTVSATSAGSVRVTASASGYTSPYVDLTFNEKPTSPFITPEKSSTSGYTGQNETISFTYGNLSGSLGVSSSNTSVVTVETPSYSAGEGSVQFNFVGAGSTTVKFKDGSTELASVSVSVTASSVTITGLPASKDVYIGKTVDLGSLISVTATGIYSNAVTWESDDDGIATVTAAGVVSGVSEGDVDITVTSDDYPSATMTCTVSVSEAPLEYEIVFGTAEGTSGITDFSNTSYVIPSGVTLNNIQGNVYSNTSNQAASLRFGKGGTTGSFDATISGNYYITSVKCNLKYYGSDTTATFAVTPSGGSAISKSLTADWADYTYDVSAAKTKTVTLGTDVNGKRAYLSGFTITYAAAKVLSNIALSGTYPTTFTKGDTFSHSGMVVTANYSDSTSATVTSSATWSSPDMSTPGAKTITVSYSDEYGSASQTYSITVSYANPTGIVLSQYTKTLALLEEFDVADVEVTINPEATADQSLYEWVVQDSDGLVEGDTYEFNDGVFYASEPADAVVLRCQSTKEGYTSTIYADVTVEITGNPIVTLFNANDQDKTNGSESVYTDAGDITYHVSAENFSGTISYAWSSSNTSIISIDSDNGTSCDFYVEGDEGSARLSCRVTDTASHDVTVYIDVTVEAWSVTSVSWTAPTIDVFSGASLTSSDVSSWNVKYSTDSGKTNQTAPVGDIVVKVNGAAVSLPHTWVAANDGKTLCVEYRGVSSSTTTVAVTQSIHNVYAPLPGDPTTSTLTFSAACSGSGTSDGGETWTVTSDGTESTYDPTKGIHYGTSGAAVQYINLTSSDFTTGKITSVVVNASTASGVTATVAVNVGGNAFGGAAKSLSQTATEYTFEGEVDADEIEVIITKPSSATKAIYCKSIAVTYVEESEETVNIANNASHKAAQRAAVAYAQAFNAAMDNTENCTTGLDAAWTTCSNAYNSFKTAAAALGETEEAWALNLVKYATKQYSDDSGEACIERMMKTYEICVQKHGKTAFMSDLVTLGARPVSVLSSISKNTSTVAIIVVISVVSVVAVGGYFYLRKKKED